MQVLFGDVNFGRAIDVWSLGVILAELAGSRFTRLLPDGAKQHTEKAYAVALFVQLGRPPAELFASLPAWEMTNRIQQFPHDFKAAPRSWPQQVRRLLAPSGLEFLQSCVAWSPLERPSCEAALQHPFLIG